MKAIDLFAGAGGFTLAAERVGIDVIFAANHWPKAVEVHAANHPRTQHSLEELCEFDYSTLDAFDLLLAGPACQPASRAGQVGRANSQKVRDDHMQMRATLWAVVDCLRICRPKFAVIENIPEIAKREDVNEWLADLALLGYSVTEQLLCASRFGVAQRRVRMFYIAVHEGPFICVSNPDVPEIGVETFFDASAGGWVPFAKMRATKSERGEPTARERAEYANEKLGGALGWGAHVSHRGAWGRLMSEPATTLTTKAGQLWWVRDGQYRQWTDNERKQATGFPTSYDMCGATKAEVAKLLGNAVPPDMAAHVIRAATQQRQAVAA